MFIPDNTNRPGKYNVAVAFEYCSFNEVFFLVQYYSYIVQLIQKSFILVYEYIYVIY